MLPAAGIVQAAQSSDQQVEALFRREPSDAELAALEDIESAGWFACDGPAPVRVTFLDLVKAVSEVSTTESEVVATVAYMLSSGSIELIGEACH